MSLNSILFSAAAVLAMAPLYANAHLILKSPVPYGVQTKDPLKSADQFPTKGIALTVNTMNEWAVGSKQELAFAGTAVHGGGSCQVSITTDKTPTANSKFKVIHSFQGGCPAAIPGNYLESEVDPAPKFSFDIPSELPNGVMSGAWSWVNKVGQREFYMALFPVTITGGTDDMAAFDALPDMAVANIGVNGNCATAEGKDYKYPNPGKYVTDGGTGPLADLCVSGAVAESVPQSDGGGNGSIDPGASSAAGSPTPPASQPATTPPSTAASSSTFRTIKTVTAPMPPLPSKTDTVLAPGAGSGSAPAPAPVPTGQSPVSPIAPQPQPSAAPAPAPPSPAGNGESCTTDGVIVCSADGTQFGICNFGKAKMMSVASGTKCVNGAIAKRGDYSHRNQRTAV